MNQVATRPAVAANVAPVAAQPSALIVRPFTRSAISAPSFVVRQEQQRRRGKALHDAGDGQRTHRI
jgi:hypothetical protein